MHAANRYLYCDEIYLEADNVLATLYVAKKYIVPHLARACVNYLETSLTAKNACLLLSQSRLFEEPELMQRCWEVIDAQVCDRLDTLHLNPRRTDANDIENCDNANASIRLPNDANNTDTGNAIAHFPILNNSWKHRTNWTDWFACDSCSYTHTHIAHNIRISRRAPNLDKYTSTYLYVYYITCVKANFFSSNFN